MAIVTLGRSESTRGATETMVHNVEERVVEENQISDETVDRRRDVLYTGLRQNLSIIVVLQPQPAERHAPEALRQRLHRRLRLPQRRRAQAVALRAAPRVRCRPASFSGSSSVPYAMPACVMYAVRCASSSSRWPSSASISCSKCPARRIRWTRIAN
jgi:hypothetical protein